MEALENADNRLVAGDVQQEDAQIDVGLRPTTLAEFIGQEKIKENLDIFLSAAKKRGEPIEHVLLYGNPGLGKTTLAHVIAHEMGANIKVTSGPALERVGDLAAILSSLETGDILFIDEIHRLNKTIEEVLYPAMEDFALDVVIGKGPSARTIRLALNRFTIIGATTRLSLLSAPLRDRFGVTLHISFYEEGDIRNILARSARLLEVTIDTDALGLLASRSRRTPRVANRLLKRVRDYVEVKHAGIISAPLAVEALAALDIDPMGLDDVDRRLLGTIIEKFNGGPVGLSALSAATAEEIATIEEVHEPFLMQVGLIERTPRGRMATVRAYQHLGFAAPARPALFPAA
ncbi:Holliday junction branch migration DNA helicase RuvB [Patescibacteria group bacterium]|nr:MAG: Holliday junction branch migration DNA helicase RuvB [Patescibacteria group bacterium]